MGWVVPYIFTQSYVATTPTQPSCSSHSLRKAATWIIDQQFLTSMEKNLYNLTSSHSSRFQTDWNIVRWFHVVSTDFTPQTCQLGWQQCLLLVLLFHLLLQLGFLVIPVESPLGSHGFCVTRVRMELTCLAACEFSSWDIFIPDICVRPPDCSTGGCSNFTGSNLIYSMAISGNLNWRYLPYIRPM